MNKITIPSILGIVILVAIIFAFAPFDKATTVHNLIGGAISISDMFADIGTAASTNNDAITVDFVIIEHDGGVIAGLTAADFSTDFIAGTTNPGAITITVTESGSGGYRLTIEPTNNWSAGRANIVLTATSGGFSTTALIVVNIS